jgi:inner membrane protein
VSGLARGLQPVAAGPGLLGNAFGVSLIKPVDIYQQAMRSVKYGNLIVLLTFTAFFLVEMVRRLILHPMQYLLVGLALVIFFLLLLALSEHMVFALAYCVAATACVALVAVYLTSAMGNAANGAGVALTLGALYAMLYAILKSEDNALLMGSLLLFFALAAVMIVTRRVDWYRLDRQLQAPSSVNTTGQQGVRP